MFVPSRSLLGGFFVVAREGTSVYRKIDSEILTGSWMLTNLIISWSGRRHETILDTTWHKPRQARKKSLKPSAFGMFNFLLGWNWRLSWVELNHWNFIKFLGSGLRSDSASSKRANQKVSERFQLKLRTNIQKSNQKQKFILLLSLHAVDAFELVSGLSVKREREDSLKITSKQILFILLPGRSTMPWPKSRCKLWWNVATHSESFAPLTA